MSARDSLVNWNERRPSILICFIYCSLYVVVVVVVSLSSSPAAIAPQNIQHRFVGFALKQNDGNQMSICFIDV